MTINSRGSSKIKASSKKDRENLSDAEVNKIFLDAFLRKRKAQAKRILQHISKEFGTKRDFKKGVISDRFSKEGEMSPQLVENLLYALWRAGFLHTGHCPGWYRLGENFADVSVDGLQTLDVFTGREVI